MKIVHLRCCMCRWLPWADFYWSCVSHFRGSDSENGWSGGNRLSLFVCSLAHTRVQVGMSLLSLVVTDESTGVVRVMRALRVLRIFGRLPSLRKVCVRARACIAQLLV